MFEWMARGLAGFTTRRPWFAIIAVIAMVVVLSAQGRPEMSNDSAEFAPDDPAIAAADRIETLFGSDASVTPLQVVFVAESGDVISMAGLDAASAVAEAIETTELDGVRLADPNVCFSRRNPTNSRCTASGERRHRVEPSMATPF